MTRALELAIERLRHLPDERQDALAQLMLHEMDADERWARSTEANAGKLPKLVDEILAADLRGECEPLDPEHL